MREWRWKVGSRRAKLEIGPLAGYNQAQVLWSQLRDQYSFHNPKTPLFKASDDHLWEVIQNEIKATHSWSQARTATQKAVIKDNTGHEFCRAVLVYFRRCIRQLPCECPSTVRKVRGPCPQLLIGLAAHRIDLHAGILQSTRPPKCKHVHVYDCVWVCVCVCMTVCECVCVCNSTLQPAATVQLSRRPCSEFVRKGRKGRRKR